MGFKTVISRAFSSMSKIRVGFVPEHFSTPLHFADQHGFFAKRGLQVELLPYPSGSGHLIQSLGDDTIDVAVGLTEAFVAQLANGNDNYGVIGTYVKSPLCWAISTGKNRDELTSEDQLAGKRIGVSRIGSGSYVMSFVLGHQKKWINEKTKNPFEKFVVLQNFKNLRDSVNLTGDVEPSDSFMWEYFTSKKYYDSGEIKQIGEIYTPWPSWVITSQSKHLANPQGKAALSSFLEAVNEGISYFNDHPEEAVDYIASNLDYSKEDASAWLKTVKFAEDVTDVDDETIIAKTVQILHTAGMVEDLDGGLSLARKHTVLLKPADSSE